MSTRCPAAGILDEALSRRYRLPVGTRGLRAGLTVTAPDGTTHGGQLQVGCARHVAADLPDAPAPVTRWVSHELSRWAQGHLYRPFAAAEGRYEIHVHAMPDGSRLARLVNDATGAWFRLRDGRVVAQGRSLGDTAVLTTPIAWLQVQDSRDLVVDERMEFRDLSDGTTLRVEERATEWTDRAPYLPLAHRVRVTDERGTATWQLTMVRPSILLVTPSGNRTVQP